MICAVAQFTPEFGNVPANVQRIEEIIAATECDVLVFPELATCGYFFRSTRECLPFAESTNGPFLSRIVATATQHQRCVVVGFAENDHGTLYNSTMLVLPDGTTHVYRKTHLFYREKDVFAPGDSGFSVVTLPHTDCRIGMMICYDWRFPEAARALALAGADLIVCPSNLVTHVWRMAMPVRALENKVYLAVANRCGSETNGDESVAFNGDSVLYGYDGSVLASATATEDSVIVAEIFPDRTRDKSFNTYNNIMLDRRPDMYHDIIQGQP